MKRDQNRVILGIALVILGALFVLDRVGVLPFNPFFEGWWTMFLIVPGIYYMTRQGVQVGNALLLGLGVFFLLDAQGWNMTEYILPGVLVLVGAALILKKS